MTEPYEFRYPAGCPVKVYDMALGAFYQRKRVLKHRKKVKPYSSGPMRLLLYSIVYLFIGAVPLTIREATQPFRIFLYCWLGFSLWIMLMSVISIFTTRRLMKRYKEHSREPGTFRFDDAGVSDENDSGAILKTPWQEYECCIVTSEVIVLIFKTSKIYFLEMTPDHLRHMETALRCFGKESTICYVMY